MEKLSGRPLEKLQHLSVLPDEDTALAEIDVSGLPEVSGFPLLGVRRPLLNRTIIEVAESYGVKIVFGHQLVSLKQEANDVEVAFANGKTDHASFVIGCDGLHSNTRISLFGEESASFTGLTQVRGKRSWNAPSR